jgi:catechol 2,3-dioxygenase-like lactoylglutathione lyase family enzyme
MRENSHEGGKMELIISKLVREFEQGKLTRRQLIKNLAVTVTTVAAGAASSAAAEPKGFHAVSVNHISYRVADYAKTRDFYADLLGMKISHDDGKQCFLEFGDTFLIPRNHPSNTPRIDHIAYTIDNWDKNSVEAELRRRGLQPKPDTDDSFHVEDPSGFDLQIHSWRLASRSGTGKEMKP